MQLKIQFDVKSIVKFLQDIPKEVIPIATARALNKTAQAVQSVAVKTIAVDISVTQLVVRKNLRIEKANRTRLTSCLVVIGSQRLPIIKIDPRAKQTAQGVSYRGEGGQRKFIPHAFVALMKSGHRGVFKRLGKVRLPICELEGVSVRNMFLKPLVQTVMESQAKQRWGDYLLHELKFELSRRNYSQ
jgi:hypothetical protein